MKRNTLGRSAGGLSSAKAPPARPTGPACTVHARETSTSSWYLHLPPRLPVHPSVRPCRSSWPSRTRGAPFVRMLMPAVFRDAIHFLSLTLADPLPPSLLPSPPESGLPSSENAGDEYADFLRRRRRHARFVAPYRRRMDYVARAKSLIVIRVVSFAFFWRKTQFSSPQIRLSVLPDARSPLFPSFRARRKGFVTSISFRATFFSRTSTEGRRLRLTCERVFQKNDLQGPKRKVKIRTSCLLVIYFPTVEWIKQNIFTETILCPLIS